MSDERPLRDELEQLGAAVKDTSTRLAAAEVAAAHRAQADTTRLDALKAQRDALTALLPELLRRRAAQLEELRAAAEALDRARASVPAHARASGPAGYTALTPPTQSPWSTSTPGYARNYSWLGRLIERWLVSSGRSWK